MVVVLVQGLRVGLGPKPAMDLRSLLRLVVWLWRYKDS